MKCKGDLPQAYLLENLKYDPDTGLFEWRTREGNNRRKAGAIGYLTKSGYLVINLDYKPRLCHRMAWIYMHGDIESGIIDHKNGTKSDNRLENLRLTDHSGNNENIRKARKHNKSGLIGAMSTGRAGIWKSSIRVRGVIHKLGEFDSPELASNAYLDAKRLLHKACTI
jgi:hypothetical protein